MSAAMYGQCTKALTSRLCPRRVHLRLAWRARTPYSQQCLTRFDRVGPVPSDRVVPTHVLTKDAVRWSIDTLGGRRIHPAFIYYLYLRKMDVRDELDLASASSAELQALLTMPGGPADRPYYRPLRERGDRTGQLLRSFWLQPNLAGSWSPGSLKRITRAAWLVSDSNEYVLPEDHARQALARLLYNTRVSAIAMGSYFLRNDGFAISGDPASTDVIAGFRRKFLYHADNDDEFDLLFDSATPEVDFDWFEPNEQQRPQVDTRWIETEPSNSLKVSSDGSA